MTELQSMGAKAKAAARFLACAGPLKDKALLAMAQALEDCAPAILAANREDVEAARANGMSESLLDRLSLNEARIASMASGVRQVAAQADPIGSVVSGGVRPNGMFIRRVRVPLGVVGMIYEARPNVTAGRPLPQSRKRRHSARRQGGHPQQLRHPGLHGRSRAQGWSPGRLSPACPRYLP